jgi:hypothetical protein
MKKQQILLVAVVAVVVVAAFILLRPRPEPAPPAPPAEAPETGATTPTPPAPAAPEPEVVTPPAPPAVEEPAPPEVAPEPVAPHEHKPLAPPSAAIRVQANQILATINNIPVTLKDLVPLTPGDTSSESEMEPDVFQSRLNRAIEAELTFQAARSRGVNLSAEQQDRLQQIADRAQATVQQYREQGLQWTSVTPQQIEFEQRMVSALLYQQNLVALAGGPSPQDPGYADALRALLNQLRSEANITINQPAP